MPSSFLTHYEFSVNHVVWVSGQISSTANLGYPASTSSWNTIDQLPAALKRSEKRSFFFFAFFFDDFWWFWGLDRKTFKEWTPKIAAADPKMIPDCESCVWPSKSDTVEFFFYETRSTHSILQYIDIYTVYIIFISNHTKSTWNTIEVHKFHKFTCLYILSHYPFHLFSCLAGFPVREILTTNRTSSAKINTCDSRWQPIFKRNHDEAIKPIWDIVETMALTSW